MSFNPERAAHALRRAMASEGSTPVRVIGAVNALAAHVATNAGFDGLWVSSLEVSAALGLPDTNVLGVRDLLDVTMALGRVTNLPVIVDVDNAGGHVDASRRHANDLWMAGAAALCLQDAAYPKANSFGILRDRALADPYLVARQLGCMRGVAPEVCLIARTEALIAGADLGVAMERARAYADAGADAVLIHSRDTSGRQALQVAEIWDGRAPLVTVPTAFPHLTYQTLAAAGYRMCIYANQLTRAAIAAMQVTAQQFAALGTFQTSASIPLASVGELLRVADHDALTCV